MPTIVKRKRKKGVAFTARVRVAGNEQISKTFSRMSEAMAWGEDVEKALKTGGYVGEAPKGDMVFATAIEKYMKEVSVKKKPTTSARENTIADNVKKALGKLNLRDITPGHIAQYRDKRLKTVGPSTIQKEFAFVSHLFNVARIEWSLDVTNPIPLVRRPKLPKSRIRFLKKSEIVQLLDQAKKSKNRKLYPFLLLQLHTAMRPSEGAGLYWKQVDLDNRIIDLTETKTDPRRVPLTYSAVEVLAELMPEKFDPSLPVFIPENVTSYVAMRPNRYFQRSFDNAVEKAGLEDFTMHDMRHTAASYLAMSGTDLRTLAEILGHSTLQMVMKYTHLLDEHTKEAINGINDLGR